MNGHERNETEAVRSRPARRNRDHSHEYFGVLARIYRGTLDPVYGVNATKGATEGRRSKSFPKPAAKRLMVYDGNVINKVAKRWGSGMTWQADGPLALRAQGTERPCPSVDHLSTRCLWADSSRFSAATSMCPKESS
eukprot:8384104-Pyramimonas_sp.AAC.2